jgi:Na+/glutamate symporter
MEVQPLINSLYATFGVFAFIIIGMGIVIYYLVNEVKLAKAEINSLTLKFTADLKEERDKQIAINNRYLEILTVMKTNIEVIRHDNGH